MRERHKFSASEDQFLRGNYATTPIEGLSRKLGRSYQPVYNRCKILNIVPIKGSIDDRPKVWKGCQETSPIWCPYNAAEAVEKRVAFATLFSPPIKLYRQ